MRGDETLGQLIQQARIAKGLSREALAVELKLPLRHIEAIEADDWSALPPGRPRPLARQLAFRLGLDLDTYPGAFQVVPGGRELEPPDPRRERLERMVMVLLSAASVLVVLWLVVPQGAGFERKPDPGRIPAALPKGGTPPPSVPASTPYPVLGDLLPEAPLNAQGILVNLRAMDTCEVRLEPAPEGAGGPLTRTLRVSEPWRLRVKGPFALTLDNAGVVNVEVAGQAIPHGQSVGEPWTGRFDAEGRWLKPKPKPPALQQAPPSVSGGDEEGSP